MPRTWPAAATAVLALLALPPAAPAAEMFGSSLTASPDDAIVCLHPDGCMLAQTALPGRNVTAPRDGVLVRWRASFLNDVPSQDVNLVALRRDGSKYSAVASSSTVQIAAGQASMSATTALRVHAGDHIAVRLEDGGEIGTVTRAAADASFALFAPPLFGSTEAREPDDGGPVAAEILLNADVEPDVDGDGRGDETQDRCPESPQRPTVPCTIDFRVRVPIDPPHLVVGSTAAATVYAVWSLGVYRSSWILPSASVTIDAPSHVQLVASPLPGPCAIATPQRAVCTIPFVSQLRAALPVAARVDPHTAPRALVQTGATFTASASSGARDADPSNNSVTWTVPIDEPHCGQRLIGTRRDNRIVGTEYSDIIEGRNGNDTLIGRGGRDCIEGGWGNDRLVTNDGDRDAVLCGPGRRDRAIVDRHDRPRGCEKVVRKPGA